MIATSVTSPTRLAVCVSRPNCSIRIATPPALGSATSLRSCEPTARTGLDRGSEAELITDIEAMVAAHLRPKLVFWRCLDLLTQRRVQLPREHRLTALIAAAMARRKQQLVARIEQLLTPELRAALDGLFVPVGPGTGDAVPGPRARLTLLKRLTQSTGAKDVRGRVANLLEIKAIHDRLRDLLVVLGLGRDGIGHFAGSVIRGRVSQLHQRSDPDRHLHAIAFIAHQFARLQDNPARTLLASVQAHPGACQREHKERCTLDRRERDHRLAGLVETIDRSVLGVLDRVAAIAHEAGASDADKLARIRLLLPIEGGGHGDRSSVSELRDTLAAGMLEADYDAVLESRSVKLQNKVSPILRAITLRGDATSSDLLVAVEHFRRRDGATGPGAPQAFLDADERRAVVQDGRIVRVSLYKVFLFAHVARAIKAGTLNLEFSTKYRPLDDYLIDTERWDRERDTLLERAGLGDLADAAQVLAELDDALHRQYLLTNGRIADGANPGFRRSARHRFTIATPKKDEDTDEADLEPLWSLLPRRHIVPLPELLATVNRHAGFSAECRPWQHTRQHAIGAKSGRNRAIYAAVMGLGCGIGVRRMARIARGASRRPRSTGR